MREKIDIEITTEYIELYKLLKWANIVESGAMGKMLIENGAIYLNGKIEFRKRKKIYPKDVVIYKNIVLNIL